MSHPVGSPPYSELAYLFLEVRTQMKLYHWKTKKYARHKATDRFLETFEPLVDRFVEAAQGILAVENDRIKNFNCLSHAQQTVVGIFYVPITDANAKEWLFQFRTHMSMVELPQSELAQIRDDMLEITDVTLYLFTLK